VTSIKPSFLKELDLEKTLAACVGSPLRGDDRIGLVVCEELSKCGFPSVKCEYGLENCIQDIEEVKPGTLLIIDAVYSDKLGEGDVVLINPEEASDYAIPTTHSLPMRLVIDTLLKQGVIGRALILGISVKKLDVSLEISPRVLEAGLLLSKSLCDTFHKARIEE